MDEAGVAENISALLVGMMGMFVLAMIIVVFVVVYQKKLVRQDLKHKEAQEEHRLALLRATLESQELERKRVGGELHDAVGGILNATKLHFQALRPNLPKELTERTDLINNLINESVNLVRHVSHQLYPAHLEKSSLKEAIGELNKQTALATDLKCEFSMDGQIEVNRKISYALYRIYQELLTNTIKHAKAKAIQASLTKKDDQFCFTYKDDGRGMADIEKSKKGLGLKNIESRVLAVNGQVGFNNQDSQGFNINIQIPNYETSRDSHS